MAHREPSRCSAATYHSPKPLRYVWHLILPAVCGGTYDPSNMVELCDGCRASVMVLMGQIAAGRVTVDRPNRRQLALARQGFRLAEEAGRTGDIPREF